MLAEEGTFGLGYWHWGQRRIFSPVKSRCASAGRFQALIAALQGLIPKAVVDLVQGCVQGLLFFLRGAEELSLGGRPPSAILPALKPIKRTFRPSAFSSSFKSWRATAKSSGPCAVGGLNGCWRVCVSKAFPTEL